MTSSFECAESISRRSFLRASAILTFAALPEMSFAATPGDGRLVVILLRGGMDGLFAVPPIGDPSLKGKRRHLVPDGTTKLDGLFALHPSLSNVSQFYRAGQAVIVHATSNGYTGRSHFQGQNLMETGADQPYALQTGWLGRALDISGYTSRRDIASRSAHPARQSRSSKAASPPGSARRPPWCTRDSAASGRPTPTRRNTAHNSPPPPASHG